MKHFVFILAVTISYSLGRVLPSNQSLFTDVDWYILIIVCFVLAFLQKVVTNK